VLIKQQHNLASKSMGYPLKLPRIMHEYVLLWQKQRSAVMVESGEKISIVGTAPRC